VSPVQKEIELNPSYADANVFLGDTLRKLGRVQEAIAPLRRAVALDPGSALNSKTLGFALAEAGRFEDAIAVLAEGEKKFPNNRVFPARRSISSTR
jgi:predicted Zn-dependent protease